MVIMDSYDIQYFPQNYCINDIAHLAQAVHNHASLLVIGMPGCGKSRLLDFFTNRTDVLAKYHLNPTINFVHVDGDTISDQVTSMYARLLLALNPKKTSFDQPINMLKEQLLQEVSQIAPEDDLVIVFDNFRRSLQQALGADFFNFLFALRNSRPRLNLSFLFLTNLQINRSGFYKLERLFDQGIDHAICWLSLLNEADAFFSIERQWRKAGRQMENLTDAHKQAIYKMSGGHALLNRYLSHLMALGEINADSSAAELLQQGSLSAACTAIWRDLSQRQKNLVIDIARQPNTAQQQHPEFGILQKVKLLDENGRFFSPIFTQFVHTQQKSDTVQAIACNLSRTNLTLTTIDQEAYTVPLTGLSIRKRALLCYIIANFRETCTKDQLKNVGWTADDLDGVTDQALSRQMDDIRRWLREQPQLNQHLNLESVWGIGYRLLVIDT